VKIAIATLAVAALAGTATASNIIQTIPFGPSTPNFNQVLTFNRYAGPASDLVQIEVRLSLNVSGGQLELDNDGADPASGTADLGASAGISSVDVPLVNNAFLPVVGNVAAATSSPFNIAGDDGDGAGFQAGGADYFNFLGGAGSDNDAGFIANAVFAAYAGGGTFNILVNATQIFDYGALGGISFAGSPVTASGEVTVIYKLIPTPGAAALLGLGGLVAARRRRA
jgi:hypothetical protein